MPLPTLPAGVIESSGRLFSDFLIESVSRRARTPISQATLDTWEVLAIADEQVRGYVVPLMLESGEDYLTIRSNIVIDGAVSTYRPPSRAMKLREIQFLDADGDEIDVPRVAIEELEHAADGFYFLGNSVVLVDPAKWAGYTMQVTCYLRPSRLVLAADSGIVSSVNRGTGAITLHTASAALTGATLCDLIQGTPPFEVVAFDVPCSVAGAAVTITTPANIPTTWGASGDIVCLPQQSPAPQIHPDLFPLLAQAVTVQILDGNGDGEAFTRATAILGKLQKDATLLLTHRVEGEVVPFGGYSPLWDRSWGR